MKALIFMLPVALTVFIHNFIFKGPPDMREVLKSYYLNELKDWHQVLNFIVLTPIREEWQYRFPAWALLMTMSTNLPDKKTWQIFTYGTVTAVLLVSTYLWAFGGHPYPLPVFGFGLIWGWLMIKTRNILYPMLFHMGSNLVALFGIWIGFRIV